MALTAQQLRNLVVNGVGIPFSEGSFTGVVRLRGAELVADVWNGDGSVSRLAPIPEKRRRRVVQPKGMYRNGRVRVVTLDPVA
jgi:hypothetical protein